MNLNFVSSWFYQSVTMSHGSHSVDEKVCALHSLSVYMKRLSSLRCKPMKSKLLLNGPVRGLHGSNGRRGNLFCPFYLCVVIHRLVKCQYSSFGPLHSTTCLVRNKVLDGNIILMFIDEKCIPAFFLSLMSCRYRGHLLWLTAFRLDHSGVFFASFIYFEPSSDFAVNQ